MLVAFSKNQQKTLNFHYMLSQKVVTLKECVGIMIFCWFSVRLRLLVARRVVEGHPPLDPGQGLVVATTLMWV